MNLVGTSFPKIRALFFKFWKRSGETSLPLPPLWLRAWFRKLNLPHWSSIYVVFLPLEMQKRLKQTKVCHAFSYFVWKETTHKPLKVAAANRLFSSVYVIGTACFDECFSLSVITKRQYFSWKFIVTLRLF